MTIIHKNSPGDEIR